MEKIIDTKKMAELFEYNTSILKDIFKNIIPDENTLNEIIKQAEEKNNWDCIIEKYDSGSKDVKIVNEIETVDIVYNNIKLFVGRFSSFDYSEKEPKRIVYYKIHKF